MEVSETGFIGLSIITPRVFGDHRGYFYESYSRKEYAAAGIDLDFVQDNQSASRRGVIRGLHYQLEPYAQAKLVRAISGAIYDVVVDIRRNSPTFGKWFGLELSEENKLQLFVPAGFAHGFSVLSDQAVVLYKTDAYYCREAERGIVFNDPDLAIDWKTDPAEAVISDKDLILPRFAQAEINFNFNL
jgi:dTDP-4-dehydrorhamnose 3,5-epimerase